VEAVVRPTHREVKGGCSVVWCEARVVVETVSDHMRDSWKVRLVHTTTDGGRFKVEQEVSAEMVDDRRAREYVVQTLVRELEQSHLTEPGLAPAPIKYAWPTSISAHTHSIAPVSAVSTHTHTTR
jgi:hypothetical protein